MSYAEHAVVFPCGNESLLGILAKPDSPNVVGVLIVVGGPQYRVGSHRQFVLLSRSLAEAGYPVFRFDYRGMGDSSGPMRNFEAVNDDIAAAIESFRESCPETEKIVLWGLCDAASASLLYWDSARDARVGGLVLLNPWVRSEASLAKTHIKHYYGRRLFQAEFWKKLLTGRLAILRALKGFVGTWLNARNGSAVSMRDEGLSFQQRMRRGLAEFSGPSLLILSGNDYTAREFVEASKADATALTALSRGQLKRVDIPAADHTFSSRELRQAVELATLAWIQEFVPA